MLIKNLKNYKELTDKYRDVVKWHPWTQVAMWLWDYEAYNGHAWTMTEANEWVKAKVQENWAMLEEVNANPLHRGLIYPPLQTDWVSYVITDIIQLGWTGAGSEWTEHTMLIKCPLILSPYVWLNSQLEGYVGTEMCRRDIGNEIELPCLHGLLLAMSMKNHYYDIGYTKRWEQLTDQRLCGTEFRSNPGTALFAARPWIRYRALR